VDRDQPIQLTDVFEDSQLAEKYLTEADIAIKNTDIPERYQLLRQPFKLTERTEEATAELLQEEARWVFSLIWPKKSMDSRFREPLQASIKKVLEYINIDNYEIPFIFQHRKDYLIHENKIAAEDSIDGRAETKAEKMLNQDDCWEILELDLRWKALIEKRDTLDALYQQVGELHGIQDELIEDLRPKAATNEEIQDIQDYFHFKYSAELKDVIIADNEANGVQKRARGSRNVWDKLRSSRVYQMVQAFGITAEAFALNATASGSRTYTEDPSEQPDDMADSLIDPPEYQTGAQVLRAAKAMYSEELVTNPRLKRYLREAFYTAGQFHCHRTEKGARTITEDHRYFEFKYLRNQDLQSLMTKPELYLRMLQAESEGLVEVRVTLINAKNFRTKLYSLIESDNYSAIAESWNKLRREVLDMSLDRLEKIIAKGVKEALRTECETRLGKQIRLKYSEKLDQAPFKVVGLAPGDRPRVLALSNGAGNVNRDAICWVQLDEDGRVTEHGKFVDLRPGNKDKYLPDGKDVKDFVALVKKHKPDVIGVSGFSPETRKLYKDLQELVERNNLEISEVEDVDNPEDRKLEVIIVNDECARLYHTSERAVLENPALPPIVRYCIGLARYLQDPMLEYAALGKNITSILFDPNQDLLPPEKLHKWLETAMVDMVNLVGVDLEEAYANTYLANLLPFVCGLGPRKTDQLIRAIQKNGGVVNSRSELLGDDTLQAACGPTVWQNCASFFNIDTDESEQNADYLDHTRIHPEDYDIARKMAADALDFDEEDIKAETDEGGPSAVVRKLVKDDQQDKVNDLVLEEYADQLEQRFQQRKRATLETIRAELLAPFEELRANLAPMSSEDVFAMLTGETEESLVEGMIVPVTIRRIFQDHIECKLDNGLEGGIGAEHYPEGVGNIYEGGRDPRSVYHTNQVVQAIVQFLNKRALTCQLSLRGDLLRKPFKKRHTATPGEWDDEEEAADKKQMEQEREAKSGRAQRVIKHPLFKPFSTSQAQEYLGSQGRGDCVIRPSSKGLDHLAVTWKVFDNVYQHIDVVELNKENEFALGKTLKIGGKYTYSDLDELIQLHIKSMAKKVDEITNDERFQPGSKKETGKHSYSDLVMYHLINAATNHNPVSEQWLEAYVEANPRRSMYAFCINRDFAGYFNLCFKPAPNVSVQTWPVKVIPRGFEMRKNEYPDMQSLKNGFKMLMARR
jgi:transcription elongation factor SPT6